MFNNIIKSVNRRRTDLGITLLKKSVNASGTSGSPQELLSKDRFEGIDVPIFTQDQIARYK